MRVINVFIGLSAIVIIANGQHEKINESETTNPEKIVSDQEIVFPASLLDIAQLQSVEAQIPEAINPTIHRHAEEDDQSDNKGDSDDEGDDDDDNDGSQDNSENEDDDDSEGEALLDEKDWVGAADQPAISNNIQKQNHILTTSWSTSGSYSYPIVIDTDFVFNPITLAPESSRVDSASAIRATVKPAVRNKKKMKSAVSEALTALPVWPMIMLLSFIASFLIKI